MIKDTEEVTKVINLINRVHDLNDKQMISSSPLNYEEYKKELSRIINLDSNIIKYELNELNTLEALNEKYGYCVRKEFEDIILKLINELKEVVYPKNELKDYSISKFQVVENNIQSIQRLKKKKKKLFNLFLFLLSLFSFF